MSNLINAVPIAVTYRDGRAETLHLGELTLRQLYKFIEHLGGSDTPALVALCAGKPVDWVDTLADESFDRLASEAVRLNFHRAIGRAQHDPIAAARLLPLALELNRALQLPALSLPPATPGGSGSGSSPAPAPLASATGSDSSI